LDDFERDYPGFDWKNTPAYKHPGGRNCPCPKHEYIREQINVARTVSKTSKEVGKITLKFCPDHYKVYLKEVIPAMPFKYRMLTKIALKLVQYKLSNSNTCNQINVFTANLDLVVMTRKLNCLQLARQAQAKFLVC